LREREDCRPEMYNGGFVEDKHSSSLATHCYVAASTIIIKANWILLKLSQNTFNFSHLFSLFKCTYKSSNLRSTHSRRRNWICSL
jgi:hypothetical protein